MTLRISAAHHRLPWIAAALVACSPARFREPDDGGGTLPAFDAQVEGGSVPSPPDSGPDGAKDPVSEAGGPIEPMSDATVHTKDGGRDGGPDSGVSCPALPLVAPGLGHAVAAGDFDGDHRFDLALGQPAFADHAGRVCVHYGKDFVDNEFSANCQTLRQGLQLIPGSPEGLGLTGDRFGFSLVPGDFDANSVTDLAVGSPFEAIQENSGGAIDQDTGLVSLIFGTKNLGLNALDGLSTPLIAAEDWYQDRDGTRAGSAEDFDLMAAALAAIDINGDGASDLFMGVPGKTPTPDTVPSAAGAGAVLQISGPLSNTALAKSFVFTAADFAAPQAWPVTSAQGVRAGQELLGATLFAVATDLPGMGARTLLLAAAPGESEGLGAVYGWFMDPTLGFAQPTKKFVIATGADSESSLGKALVSDGRRVFIGAPGQSKGQGRVYVVDLTQIPTSPNAWPEFSVLKQPGDVAGGPETGDAFGYSLALQHRADFDLLLVGAPGETTDGVCQVGIVHRFRAADLSYYDSVDGRPGGAFGYAVGAGDFDGDGVDEAFATAPGRPPAGQLVIWD